MFWKSLMFNKAAVIDKNTVKSNIVKYYHFNSIHDPSGSILKCWIGTQEIRLILSILRVLWWIESSKEQ